MFHAREMAIQENESMKSIVCVLYYLLSSMIGLPARRPWLGNARSRFVPSISYTTYRQTLPGGIMVFGLFTRKSTLDDTQSSASPESRPNEHDARLPTPTPSTTSAVHHSPLRFPTALRAVLGGSTTDLTLKHSNLGMSDIDEGGHDLGSPAPPPPETPSPPPPPSSESKALYQLMLTIPPKTLHAYTLAHLQPRTLLPSRSTPSPGFGSHAERTTPPPSPNTVAKLATFFSTLVPPPLLHCVRCHGDFYAIENDEKDKACRVAHDDESALVERVSGGVYETLWGCCGQTAEGDGSEGPPDGWCYEGRHTTDVKRARFRADSTIHHDKLTPCLKLNCHGTRDQLPRPSIRASPSRHSRSSPTRKSNLSPTRSQASVVIITRARKRPRKPMKETSASEDEQYVKSTHGRSEEGKGKHKVGQTKGEDENTSMAVDELHPHPKSKAKPKPISSARPPPSTATSPSLSASTSNINSASSIKPKPTTAKQKTTSSTLLSQSHTYPLSDSDTSSRAHLRTRSLIPQESRGKDASRPRVTPVKGAPVSRTMSKSTIREPSRARPARKATEQLSQSQVPTSENEVEADETRDVQRGRDRKKRRVDA
ncbi:hypothetical protein PAXRUDRAFT_35962 [Paxillus rubicundulus Ve08.2h10]|uniref:Uncharacterized protein n=1 Tax=Paxillus rubicundulus Ve08.2h10 TaxID=930991 RepID=A0A0D0CEI9_9AGAM|nr:hypothetical protein PAXRUDRAFT_35962 [Paxillus rubicundulus Ve08.2h10]